MNTPPKKILVATDFSDGAQVAVDYAIVIAKKLDAELVLMHAWEIPVYAFPDGAMLPGGLFDNLESVSDEALQRAVETTKKAGIRAHGVLRMGPAWREIGVAANDEKVDLVVIGTHGRRGVARLLLGSVAERVVRTSAMPVLTVGSRKE